MPILLRRVECATPKDRAGLRRVLDGEGEKRSNWEKPKTKKGSVKNEFERDVEREDAM